MRKRTCSRGGSGVSALRALAWKPSPSTIARDFYPQIPLMYADGNLRTLAHGFTRGNPRTISIWERASARERKVSVPRMSGTEIGEKRYHQRVVERHHLLVLRSGVGHLPPDCPAPVSQTPAAHRSGSAPLQCLRCCVMTEAARALIASPHAIDERSGRK